MKWTILLAVLVGCATVPQTREEHLAGVRRQAIWQAQNCINREFDMVDHLQCKREAINYCLSQGAEADCYAGIWTSR